MGDSRLSQKVTCISVLVLAQITGMSLWFTSAAVLPDMVMEGDISSARQALLSTGVQAGFVVGALFVAISGIADRLDPRRVLAFSAVLAALANVVLLVAPLGGDLAIGARIATGALLAGVYPIGMKIAVGWGTTDRGFLIGILVGALTLGSAAPHLMAFLGGAEWRLTVSIASIIAAAGGLAMLTVSLGPHHARSPGFQPGAIRLAWSDIAIRRAYLGYFGHMWELYAMWAWIGAAVTISYGASMDQASAVDLGKLTAFLAVALGGLASIAAGRFADRMGKAEVTIIAMAVSGAAALLTALTFGGPAWLTLVLAVIWGIAVIPDSAQFSAIVADNAPPELAGSLLTLQTAIGFSLTIFTVQWTPVAAAAFGWPTVLAVLALGPALGIIAMLPLRRAARG
jgi:MFS family permease